MVCNVVLAPRECAVTLGRQNMDKYGSKITKRHKETYHCGYKMMFLRIRGL